MEIIKIERKTEEKVKKEKLNVAAYARVSTEHDDQLGSFESQKKYYEDKIKQNEKWNYVNVYADEGISGTNTMKRENFLRMIKDACNGKIDLILTKSISRFARNTMDTLKYIRELKKRNVGVFFEEENINTLDETGEFLITVLSSVAQQEIENMSSHVKKGHAMLLKSGNMILGNGCYGYRFVNEKKKIEIVPEEAKIVKKIFKLYLKGTSCREIARILDKESIKTYRSVKKWVPTSIRYILANEKYVGDLLQGKQVKLNPFAKRIKNIGQSDKYLIRDFHKPIISKEDFEKAQKLLKANNHYSSRKKISKLSYKLKCGYCFSAVNVVRYKKDKAFVECTNRKKNGRNSCPESKDMIKNKIFNIIRKGFRNSKNIILNNDDNDLMYVKDIINKDTTNFEDEVLGKIIKLVFIGGYDSYKRPLPFMIRVILFNNYPMNEYMIKKLTTADIKNIKTQQIFEGWISEKITHYETQKLPYKRIDISKVKIKIEIEKNDDCTLV